MKSKKGSILDKIGKVVSLRLMLEKDINTLHPLFGEDILNIDKTIHKIRKSLKSISAILFLYEFQFDQTQYLIWKSYIKSLSKQYAVVREPFIYRKIFNQVEDELKDFDNINLDELRNHLESKYNLIVIENIVKKETIRKGNEAIHKITEAIHNLHINSELKLLKRSLLISFQKSQKLYKKLSLTSSSDEFHKFRKWCKRFYFQQVVFNRIGLVKTSKQDKLLYKLTEYLGNEHDLQLFYQYLRMHFADLSQITQSFFMLKIKKLRKKALALYPKINY